MNTVFYSQAAQCVVLETPRNRYYFKPPRDDERGSEWKTFCAILRIESDIAAQTPGAAEPAVNLAEVLRVLDRPLERKFTPTGREKLSLEEIGL